MERSDAGLALESFLVFQVLIDIERRKEGNQVDKQDHVDSQLIHIYFEENHARPEGRSLAGLEGEEKAEHQRQERRTRSDVRRESFEMLPIHRKQE